ncbi:MAG TPA: hypothetical protein VIX42_08625 [Edaphobacter sp.]
MQVQVQVQLHALLFVIPARDLLLPLFLSFALPFPPQKHVISTEGGEAAAVERSLYFVVAVAFVVAFTPSASKAPIVDDTFSIE